MTLLRVRLAQLVSRIAAASWPSWPECAGCSRRHDPRDHYPLHDDTYEEHP